MRNSSETISSQSFFFCLSSLFSVHSEFIPPNLSPYGPDAPACTLAGRRIRRRSGPGGEGGRLCCRRQISMASSMRTQGRRRKGSTSKARRSSMRLLLLPRGRRGHAPRRARGRGAQGAHCGRRAGKKRKEKEKERKSVSFFFSTSSLFSSFFSLFRARPLQGQQQLFFFFLQKWEDRSKRGGGRQQVSTPFLGTSWGSRGNRDNKKEYKCITIKKSK